MVFLSKIQAALKVAHSRGPAKAHYGYFRAAALTSRPQHGNGATQILTKTIMEVPKVPDIRGLKRVCASCATRFYDFNKSPVICPKCKAEFTGIVKIRTRRGRNVIEEAKAKEASEREEEVVVEVPEEEATTVSLEEVGDEEAKAVDDEDDAAGGDLDLDDLDEDEAKDDEDLEDIEEDIKVEKE